MAAPNNTNALAIDNIHALDHLATAARFQDIFIFSPFGLCCSRCKHKIAIKLEKRSIRDHLKKHGMDSKVEKVQFLFHTFKAKLHVAESLGTIQPYRNDEKSYRGYSCMCGQVFPRKDNAVRHCNLKHCDSSKLQRSELMKLCCGRFVSQAQVDALVNNCQPRITQQFDYSEARAVLLPFLPQREKQDHAYTHMYVPLISGCCRAIGFTEKNQS
jgi:hypothetical protein